MFVHGVAIRPVPAWAVVDLDTLRRVQDEIAALSGVASPTLGGSFERFERRQPVLAEKMNAILGHRLDSTALALGYFLTIAIWLAFEEQFANRVAAVSADGLEAVEASLGLEEELRANLRSDPLDVDDVVACAQPGVMAFVQAHIETALETMSSSAIEGTPRDIDIDDVHRVYRALMVLALALSHAVRPTAGEATRAGPELLA